MQNPHTLQALLSVISPLSLLNAEAAPAGGFSLLTANSQSVCEGAVFVAVRGTRVDGHSFIAKAVDAGAAAVVCETIPDSPSDAVVWILVDDATKALGHLASQWHGNPSRHLTLIGVTGTNGKTTIATLIYELARITGHRAGLLSTVVNKVNDRDVPSTHTTPDPIALNALLAQMVDEGCDIVAMEVSSHAAAQHRIAGLDFDGAVFTNLTRDHLDYHGTFAEYLRAKQSFFDGLKPDAFALVNIDDRNGTIMVQNTKARRYTYSIRSNADFRGTVVEDRLDGMSISFNGTEVETLFAGRFNAFNLSAVFGTALLLGFDKTTALTAISQMTPVAGRFQPFTSADGVTAIVDYAHTPDALINVLDTIAEINRRRGSIITVCGCGGDRDRGKRPIMAAEATRRSDRVILTSDNPRSESPEAIINEMRTGVAPEDAHKVLAITDRREAIRTAVALAAPGDIILVAGKGHEPYQIIGSETLHFDDREEVRHALNNR